MEVDLESFRRLVRVLFPAHIIPPNLYNRLGENKVSMMTHSPDLQQVCALKLRRSWPAYPQKLNMPGLQWRKSLGTACDWLLVFSPTKFLMPLETVEEDKVKTVSGLKPLLFSNTHSAEPCKASACCDHCTVSLSSSPNQSLNPSSHRCSSVESSIIVTWATQKSIKSNYIK